MSMKRRPTPPTLLPGLTAKMRTPITQSAGQRTLSLRILLLVCTVGIATPGLPVFAEGHGAPAHGASKEKGKTKHVSTTFELGSFELREVRPSRKETTSLNFTAYFALSPEITQEQLEQLEHAKHRLRDQVIVAVRTAQSMDFQEPGLDRLRRIIMFRIRRMLKEDVVREVLISEFTYKAQPIK